MGSSRRRVSSPTSPSSSYSALWGRVDENKGTEVGVGRIRQGAERFTVEDEREVARRVLEDLEGLYFDGSSDDESEDEDEVSSISEWGSDTSSRSSSGKRKAGGMSLEELTVALNAAIEFHRPAQLSNSMKESKREADEQCGQRSNKRHQRSRSRCQEKESSIASSPRGEPTMEFFQDMLERKQQHFYAMQTAPAPEEEIIEEDRQSQRSVWSHHTDTANREKRITTLVRDQATETEEYFQYPRFDASFGAADFQTPPHSPPRSARLRNTQIANELPITIGPTLADLAASHRRRERDRLSFRSFPGSESSWRSSSSSSTSDQRFSQSQSSKRSSASRSSNHSASNSSSSSSRASDKSNRSSRSGTSSRSSERSSRVGSNPKSVSADSKRRSQGSQLQGNCGEPQQLVLEPTTQLTACYPTSPSEIQIDRAPVPLSPDSTRIPSSPALVNWELDLSNFVL